MASACLFGVTGRHVRTLPTERHYGAALPGYGSLGLPDSDGEEPNPDGGCGHTEKDRG